MLFCEKCNFVTVENYCLICGNKNLRNVTETDYCFFVDLDEFYFSMLEGALKEESIDVVGVPYYQSGVTYANAGRAQGRKVYVRYKDIAQVREIYGIIFGLADEN